MPCPLLDVKPSFPLSAEQSRHGKQSVDARSGSLCARMTSIPVRNAHGIFQPLRGCKDFCRQWLCEISLAGEAIIAAAARIETRVQQEPQTSVIDRGCHP
jgi:hypothetical protein